MIEDPLAPFQHLQLAQVVPSKTNPRKRFPEANLQEMADNIKQHGIMQPILVRPMDAKNQPTFGGKVHHYEIVAGERRYRAGQLAGLEFIPALVRELHDLDALQLQVFENLHRDDLHPMEEAEGFQQLLHRSQDLIGLTVDELAIKVGKSRAYIYASLKLLALCPAARDAFYEDKLTQSTALLVARIPGEKLQQQALKEITKPDWQGAAPSYREAARIIHDRYTLQLTRAIFDIDAAALMPEAGSCTDCPKRSGNCTELCPDIDSADVCTDPDCFAAKREAHIVALKQQEQNVLVGAAATKIMPYNNRYYLNDGYVAIDHSSGFAGMDSDNPDILTFEQILGGDLPETITLVPKDGAPFKVIKREEAEKILSARGYQVKPHEPRKTNEDYAREQAERKEKAAELLAQRRKMADDVLAAITVSADSFHIMLLEDIAPILVIHLFRQSRIYDEDKVRLAHKYLCPEQDLDSLDESDLHPQFERALPTLGTAKIVALFAEMVMDSQVEEVKPWRLDELEEPDLIYAIADIGRKYTHYQTEPASTPRPAAHAGGDPAEARPAQTPGSATPAGEDPPPAFAEIKAKELAKRNRRQGKKVPANAGDDVQPSAAAAGKPTDQEAVVA